MIDRAFVNGFLNSPGLIRAVETERDGQDTHHGGRQHQAVAVVYAEHHARFCGRGCAHVTSRSWVGAEQVHWDRRSQVARKLPDTDFAIVLVSHHTAIIAIATSASAA